MSKLYVFVIAVTLGVMVAGCGTPSLAGSSDAATVNGQQISMAAYNTQVVYKRRLAVQSSGGVDPCNVKLDAPICTQLKHTALNDLIDTMLVRQYAAKHHITVSQSEFNAQWQQLLAAQFHSNVPVMRAWVKAFGLTVPMLRQMERDGLLQQKVLYQVTKNMPTQVPAVRLASISVQTSKQLGQVRKMLRNQSFLQVARLLLQNQESACVQNHCGELGWLPNAFLTTPERPAATAKVGSILGPFATQTTLSLLKVEGHSSNYQMNQQQQIAMREPLFAAWVERLQRHANIHRNVA
ncbi:MAG: SurA N-terminal domain-containing protein [Chloroflexota bacterium]|nr:SurA N-terminal domain-containing protein [Chloroflexota bacterium]